MIKLPGQLAAYQEVSIFPKVNGYVKKVNVDIGSKVTKGQFADEARSAGTGTVRYAGKRKICADKADLSIDREHYNRLLEASANTRCHLAPGSVLCQSQKWNRQCGQQCRKNKLANAANHAGLSG